MKGGEDMDPAWLEDKSRMEDEVMMDMMIKEFAQSLTPKQLDVFQRCLLGGGISSRVFKGKGHQ